MKIENLKKVDKGKLKAFFDLEAPSISIYGCKLMEGQSGGLWAAMPSRQYEKDGQTKWAPIIRLSDDLLDRVSKLAREAYGEPDVPQDSDEIPF